VEAGADVPALRVGAFMEIERHAGRSAILTASVSAPASVAAAEARFFSASRLTVDPSRYM
jgi:hypothetical protein